MQDGKNTNVIFDQIRIIYICHVRKECRILNYFHCVLGEDGCFLYRKQ
ncbi:hypothetical protein HMPREF2534_02194 [Bacteroides thetaiotaomicron]|nr:hypothetical protein HMPREF2534_02194 [Bacteroides thetaiotaomicron]